jgi:hypothetical protein
MTCNIILVPPKLIALATNGQELYYSNIWSEELLITNAFALDLSESYRPANLVILPLLVSVRIEKIHKEGSYALVRRMSSTEPKKVRCVRENLINPFISTKKNK